jgi:hypothetical protein
MPKETHVMNKRTPPKKRQSDFRLPRGVSMHKEPLPSGCAYVFRHTELGLLGRLVLHGLPSGHCQVSCEVAGDPADPLTARRRAVLEPVTTELVRRLDAQTSTVQGVPWGTPPPTPPPPGRLIKNKLMQCEQCDAGVALLIFADEAMDHGGLEDYARLMYAQIQATNLPTWVIGPPQGDAPLSERPADMLKVWPRREPVRRLRPDEFNPIIAALARAHCR